MHGMLWTLVLWLVAAPVAAADPTESAEPYATIRAIPGVTSPDTHPEACVGCHIQMVDIGLDARLSTALRAWEQEVPAKVMAVAEASMDSAGALEGKHPAVPLPLEDVPDSCIGCHDAATAAPPFARLVHLAHYRGGQTNHFLTLFGGECTLCHKMDPETGLWRIPSGAEIEQTE